jgi:hypothetical protein
MRTTEIASVLTPPRAFFAAGDCDRTPLRCGEPTSGPSETSAVPFNHLASDGKHLTPCVSGARLFFRRMFGTW